VGGALDAAEVQILAHPCLIETTRRQRAPTSKPLAYREVYLKKFCEENLTNVIWYVQTVTVLELIIRSYTLALRTRRKVNWIHTGSIPVERTNYSRPTDLRLVPSEGALRRFDSAP
jgi:hypothetical protein